MCVYLDVTPAARATCWTASWPASWRSTRSSRASIPRTTPMKIFPAVHYTMGGLWCDYERTAEGGLVLGSPRNQQTNVPGIFAIGECDYQFHGANRLGANSLVACIFSGLTVAPGVVSYMDNLPGGTAADQPSSLFDRRGRAASGRVQGAAWRGPHGGPNPYELHRRAGPGDDQKPPRSSATTPIWTRPTARSARWRSEAGRARWPTRATGRTRTSVFVRALEDMFPLAKTIVKGALARDECRGAHYKPEFAMPEIAATDPAERRRAGRGVVRPFRGEQPQVAQDDRSPAWTPTASRS